VDRAETIGWRNSRSVDAELIHLVARINDAANIVRSYYCDDRDILPEAKRALNQLEVNTFLPGGPDRTQRATLNFRIC